MPNPDQTPSPWDDEAKSILQGTNLLLITQVLRLGLYGDADSLRQMLQRQAHHLDPLLDSLRPTTAEVGQQPTTELTNHQKGEEILTLVIPPCPPSGGFWDWRPKHSADETNPQEVAACIAKESYSYFRQIPFVHWLKYSLGYQERSVAGLFFQHGLLRFALSPRNFRDRIEMDSYAEVIEVTPPRPHHIRF